MEEKITLQKATYKDIDIFISLERNAAHPKMYRGIADSKTMLDKLKNNIVYLIKKDEIIVGIIRYRIVNKNHIHISGVVVHSDFQGQGIARSALAILLEDLKSFKRTDLVTHPQNSKAIRLYLSFGFIIESWKDNFYGDGEPRITLVLH